MCIRDRFSYNGDRIGQGRENTKKYIKENPELASELEQKIRGTSSDILLKKAPKGKKTADAEPAAAPAPAAEQKDEQNEKPAPKVDIDAVSYTHLDVYKRQKRRFISTGLNPPML